MLYDWLFLVDNQIRFDLIIGKIILGDFFDLIIDK